MEQADSTGSPQSTKLKLQSQPHSPKVQISGFRLFAQGFKSPGWQAATHTTGCRPVPSHEQTQAQSHLAAQGSLHIGVRVLGFQNRQWLAAAGAEVEGQLCAVVAAVGEAQSVCMACTSVEKIRASLGLCRQCWAAQLVRIKCESSRDSAIARPVRVGGYL